MSTELLNVRSLARLLAGVAVLALCFGDFARGLHLLLEPHVVCLADGELIEKSERAPAAPEAAAARECRAVPGTPAIEHHLHCSCASMPWRAQATVVLGTLVAMADAATVTIMVRADVDGEHTRPALMYAPKQGPPA